MLGIVLGPFVLDLLDPAEWGDQTLILREAARVTLAIVATSIVTGAPAQKNISYHVRHLSGESGSNDGLASPLVMLPILWMSLQPSEALGRWLLDEVVLGVAASIGDGWVMGYGAGHLLHWAEARQSIERPSFLAYVVALAMLVLGFTELLGWAGSWPSS